MNKSKNQKSFFLKIWPIYALISGLLFALYQGWDQYLTPSSLGLYAVDLNTLVENNFWVAFTGFVVIYILSTVFMIPASALTIMGGFLFGTIIGVPTTVISATAGACILFMLTKYSFNDALQNTAGPFLKKMENEHWDIVTDKNAQTNFSRYVQQQFHIKINKTTPVMLNYIGHEVEGKFFWIYQEIDITKPLSSISISHTALQSVWASQVNLVNIEGFGSIKSLRFSKQDSWKNLTLSYP